jgi:hypothetical protein
MPLLQIYRAGQLFTEVSTGGSETVFNGSLGGMNKITSQFTTNQVIKFKKGDYVFHHGHTYTLKSLPKHTKDGNHTYTCTFLGREYTLYNFAFRYLNSATFPYYGTAAEHLALVLGVANVSDAGWTGTAEATTPVNIDYAKDSCRTAIQKIADIFKLEIKFDEQSVALNKKNTGRVHDLTFTYGMNNGLYSMTKTELDESEFGTRFYGYGGSTNLPQNYRGGALQLLPPTVFVDRKIANYGLIEKHVEFPDIFPERTGTVSSTTSITQVTDTSLDFDLNEVIVDGSAKIIFTTGLLRGQEFEIATYTPGTKTIKFNINKDESGYELPNSTLKPTPADQYKLVGIILPQSYIDNAETRLATALNTHADANQDPPFEFGLEIDPIFLAEQNYQFEINPGDMVQAVEPDMDVSVYLRITEISYPIFEPFAIQATIGDKINYSLAQEVVKDVNDSKQGIKQITKTSLELQRINSIRRRELQGAIFDTDNYFDVTNIRPGSIETSMLAVGTQSQDFTLTVMFKPNYNANPNSISWSAGQLVHLSIADTNKSWDIAPTILTGLVSTTLYYIYAKCAKNGSVGTIVLDPTQRRYNDDPTDYYFLIGVAHKVTNGVRPISLTYGFTEINGRFITTGRLTSADGLTWFDLDTGEISGVIKFRSSNGSIQNVTTIETAANNAVTVATNASTAANSAQASLTALQSDLGVLAFDDRVYDAMQRETIIQGGYIKSDLINVNQIIVGGNLETANGAQAKANAAQAAAENTASLNIAAQIAGIQVGGRNLLKNSNFGQGFYGFGINGGTANLITVNGSNRIKIVANGFAHGIYAGELYTVPLKQNQDYTISFDITGDYYDALGLAVGFNSGYQVIQVPNDRITRRVSVTVRLGAGAPINDSVIFYTQSSARMEFDITNIKIEEGTVATDWTPAPEDLASDAQAKANAAQAAAQNYADAQDIISLAAANLVAENIGKSKADITQVTEVYNLATDAKNRANTAYSQAVVASDAYIQTKAAVDASLVEIAAAADASNRATAAYNDAMIAWQTQYSNLTASLKPLAFSDIQQIGANSGITYINAGNIATFSIDAAYIRANVITAAYINALSIIVKNLKTSETGKSVEIDSINNNIRILDEQRNVAIEADDDSAFEGSYYTTTPPLILPGGAYPKNYLGSKNMGDGSFRYYYGAMGPGVSVGISASDANGFSTFGRKEIFTNGRFRASNADSSSESSLDQTGFRTTGLLDVSGNAILRANTEITGSLRVNGTISYNGNQGATVYELVSSSGNETRKYVNGGYIGKGNGFNW